MVDKTKEITVAPSSLEDVDQAAYNWLNETMDIKATTNKGFK